MEGSDLRHANDTVNTGVPLPRISQIELADVPNTLVVAWAEGERAGRRDHVDLSPIINTYKIFRPLRNDDALFKTARLIEDGDVVAWNGADLEIVCGGN
jgi:hypothetical protein